jgi:hypothetical protein
MLKKFLRTSVLTLGTSLCALSSLQNDGYAIDLFLDNTNDFDVNYRVRVSINAAASMNYIEDVVCASSAPQQQIVAMVSTEDLLAKFKELAAYINPQATFSFNPPRYTLHLEVSEEGAQYLETYTSYLDLVFVDAIFNSNDETLEYFSSHYIRWNTHGETKLKELGGPEVGYLIPFAGEELIKKLPASFTVNYAPEKLPSRISLIPSEQKVEDAMIVPDAMVIS